MKVIQCPDNYQRVPGSTEHTVFLGGGISNCPDWQSLVIQYLSREDDDLILINPRRTNFDTLDAAASDFQIEWEHDHLSRVDAILFWFPCETLCPITLFELGKFAGREHRPQLFVGCHQNYARRFDVIKQLSLIAPEVIVRDNLFDLVDGVRAWNVVSKHREV